MHSLPQPKPDTYKGKSLIRGFAQLITLKDAVVSPKKSSFKGPSAKLIPGYYGCMIPKPDWVFFGLIYPLGSIRVG